MLVDCIIQTVEDVVKLTYRPCSPEILVFLTPSAGEFQGEPLQQDAKYKEVGKCDFRLKSPSISETVRDMVRYGMGLSRLWLLWNVNMKSYALYRMATSSMTLKGKVCHTPTGV